MLWTWRYWSLESFVLMVSDDVALHIAWELCNDGLTIFESLQGFLHLSLCITDDDQRDVH